RHDFLRERAAEPRDGVERFRGDEAEWSLAVRQFGGGIGASRLDHRHDTELREPPQEQRLEILVAHRARRPAEQRRVDRHGAAAFAFIRRANDAKSGAIESARAAAASFADWISAPLIRSRTVRRSPGCTLIVDSPTIAARGSTVTRSVSLWCSSARRTVIIF